MSIEIVLIPAAIAAYGAYKSFKTSRSAQNVVSCEVQTRMRDTDLLVAALRETGAMLERTGTGMAASWAGVRADFALDADQVWHAVFTGDVNEDKAVGIVTAIDQAYGIQVQRAVVERLRQRAPQAGMTVVSQTVESDNSVLMVVDVGGAE